MINPKHHSLPSPPPAVPLAGRSGAPKVICQPPRAGPKLCQVLPSLTLAPYSAVVAWLALHPIIVRQSTQPRDAMGCQGQDDSASDEYCRLQVLPMLSVCQMLPNPSTDNMGQNTIVCTSAARDTFLWRGVLGSVDDGCNGYSCTANAPSDNSAILQRLGRIDTHVQPPSSLVSSCRVLVCTE